MERPNWDEKKRPVEEIKKATDDEEFETGTEKKDDMERPTGAHTPR
jgi:hypothetical protein